MKVGGLTSIFQVCIVHFLVFWWPGKFWLKKVLGETPPKGDIVTFFYRFFYIGASLSLFDQGYNSGIALICLHFSVEKKKGI